MQVTKYPNRKYRILFMACIQLYHICSCSCSRRCRCRRRHNNLNIMFFVVIIVLILIFSNNFLHRTILNI